MDDWKHISDWEASWWGNCTNTLGEEVKQLTYASKMGLHWYHNNKSPYNIDCQGRSILDIGGGPVSLLLKCENVNLPTVVDPCNYPAWIDSRYEIAKIIYKRMKGEDINLSGYDECWIYNVLQHVDDPEKIIKNAQKAGKLIRIFEWIDHGVAPGHPHDLKEEKLNAWLKGEGKVEVLDLPALAGKCYYGIFPT